MGSLGTEWETADIFSDTRLNQKTQAIGNSNQLNSITTTYPGQAIYPLDDGNGWLADRPDSRDAANTKWHYPQLRVGSVGSFGSVAGASFAADGVTLNQNQTLFFYPFTLPTTEKFYKITGVDWVKTLTNNSGTGVQIQSGIDIYDSTTGYRLNVALSGRYDNTVPATYFHRCLIPAGATCGIWYTHTGSTDTVIWNRRLDGTYTDSWTYRAGSSTTPYTQDTSTLTGGGTTNVTGLKVDWQGYY